MKQMTDVSNLLQGDHGSPLQVKRIDPAAPTPADQTHHPTPILRSRVGEGEFRRWGRLNRWQWPGRGHPRTRQRGKGTLIRHARLSAAPTIGSLTIPMIQTSFGTLLVAAIGLLALLAARFFPAPGAAVSLPPVTMTAEIKNRATRRKMTNPLTKNGLTREGHRHPEAELDNRRQSWQDDSHTDLEVLHLGPPIKRPRLL